jgi:hypothetical protein
MSPRGAAGVVAERVVAAVGIVAAVAVGVLASPRRAAVVAERVVVEAAEGPRMSAEAAKSRERRAAAQGSQRKTGS